MERDHLYNYKAVVTRVYDGDTITVDFDLGLGIWCKGQKIRLYGIDTPELRGSERKAGLESRDWLREKILDKTVYIKTIKDRKGKYGRWLGEIWLINPLNAEPRHTSLNQTMVEIGLAEKVEY